MESIAKKIVKVILEGLRGYGIRIDYHSDGRVKRVYLEEHEA